ncbi:MAG TPA: sigma factor-like helix-turn-helix DNA-binding protein [Candidatus Hydrogenedentes bacterium]|nr:sigma factor-like helix-turn-helix DNA-binding protein [Candidatus Hydrogenedentota bacterium]HOT50853.1 sigma factor-like helix-turn-helix DNA-binding protein [Candidatus Hydrogenedentota bacterium]HOV73020.1 sigma factor-like helix-turn-helix DNA-binding protein [Candidatus Hydrogenedentota bacterium]HPC15867.1 sigma factor-like helix-turn-helix DNA-binding protein [Candidatus Hydrogenedentota bacterium]HRT19725.1 sigma factor-like helix-turn-helix DNA-binding protein [Candidatus Hydrogene
MSTSRKKRAPRVVPLDPGYFASISEKSSPWHEDEQAIEEGLEWGRQKARLLRWVRLEAGRRLTARERQCLEMHFFEGITFAEMGARTGTNASSAHRAVRRSLRKLREAARSARFRGWPFILSEPGANKRMEK